MIFKRRSIIFSGVSNYIILDHPRWFRKTYKLVNLDFNNCKPFYSNLNPYMPCYLITDILT